MSAAELSLGIRTGVPATGVRQALWTDRTLVKTFGPRGTVHILPADELSFWCTGFASLPSGRSLPPELTMSGKQVDDIVTAIGDSLLNRELTVDELSSEVIARAGAWAGALVMPAFQGYWPLWRIALADAAYQGMLCFGPPQGRKVTYTRPSQFAPVTVSPGDLALRYLASYGPATSQQFAQWLAIPRRAGAQAFEAVSSSLEEVLIEGKPAFLPTTTDAPEVDGGLRLLPLFDAYTVGCHPRELLFPGQAAARALSGGQAGNVAVILISGTVGGVWHQKKTGKKLAITAEPFSKLTKALRAELESEVERVGMLVEATPILTVGDVTARAHL